MLFFLLTILLIICIFTLIGCIFGVKEWGEKINNWKTVKQVNEEYVECLMLGLTSIFGIFICSSIIAIVIFVLKIIL